MTPQHITIFVIGVIGIVMLVQADWKTLPFVSHINSLRRLTVPASIRIGVQFAFAITFVWLPGLNRVTAVVLLFLGALLGLVVLMIVTTISLFFKGKGREEPEDPFMKALRERYQTEVKAFIRVGELKQIIMDTIEQLQSEGVRQASSPSLIKTPALYARLRGSGLRDPATTFDSAVRSLIEEGRIYHQGYASSQELWRVPSDQEVTECIGALDAATVILTSPGGIRPQDKNELVVEGIKVTGLTRWLSSQVHLPIPVLGDYVMPRLVQIVKDRHSYNCYEYHSGSPLLFVRCDFRMSETEWGNRLDAAKRWGDTIGKYDQLWRQDSSGYEKLKHLLLPYAFITENKDHVPLDWITETLQDDLSKKQLNLALHSHHV